MSACVQEREIEKGVRLCVLTIEKTRAEKIWGGYD